MRVVTQRDNASYSEVKIGGEYQRKHLLVSDGVHCTTDCLGLGFRVFWMLASAHALCLPTIEV